MIRLLRPQDVGAVMGLKQAAGWNQTEQDWRNLLALEPEGCWVDEQDGFVVAASTTAVCYGQDLAWIGMVLVLPEYRGRGLARGLMEHCLRWLDDRGVRQVKLDATDMGRPLYEKLGFRDERLIERWGKAASTPQIGGVHSLPHQEIAAFDRRSFGADRTGLIRLLLEAFPGQGEWQPGKGFLLGRPGTNAYSLGPGAAADMETARQLVLSRMGRTGAAAFFWDLFPETAAAELARELGFERKRQLVRMALRPQASDVPSVLAIAGFEYG